MSSPIDVLDRKPKPKTDNVPTIYFHVPAVPTGEAFADAVASGKGWKTLQQTVIEDEAARQARKLSERYDQTPIPEPEFETEEWHL